MRSGMARGWELLRRHPGMVDTALAAVVGGLTLVFALQTQHELRARYHYPPFGTSAIVLTVLVNLPLAIRRRWPWPALLVSGAALAAYTAAGNESSENLWAPLLTFYTVVSRPDRRATKTAAALTAALWSWNALEVKASVLLAVGQAVMGVGVVWYFAEGIRNLGLRNTQLAQLTAQLHEEQAARALHAVTEERMRIARELHDVLAHHLSVVALQAGLARYVFTGDPPTASAALDTIADTTRLALDEMRGLLALLRVSPNSPTDEPGDYLPAPGLAQLPDLVERLRGAGLGVDLTVTGDQRPLPPGLDLAAFRVLQESLTNTLKHAGPTAHAEVELHFDTNTLSARAADDGGTGLQAVAPVSGGHGLIGMRERVNLYGGELDAGPLPAGGYQVRFTLPIAPPG
ncbi:sensor histidine kinase [Kitasatospora kifunensis]|uniref:histidine kinase n=1 Tax=Kitasatospora kifunensis TaxID=58351 RepID=A0A7W7R1F5_KITKI|nr:sensor histidine kinase [Kitasatospora kifunensis]MBB4923021.1 signal transduction histidine kinase [Kitasatospora kifunensis]